MIRMKLCLLRRHGNCKFISAPGPRSSAPPAKSKSQTIPPLFLPPSTFSVPSSTKPPSPSKSNGTKLGLVVIRRGRRRLSLKAGAPQCCSMPDFNSLPSDSIPVPLRIRRIKTPKPQVKSGDGARRRAAGGVAMDSALCSRGDYCISTLPLGIAACRSSWSSMTCV